MTAPWIRVAADIGAFPVVGRAMDALRMSRVRTQDVTQMSAATAVGHLVLLWGQVSLYCHGGDIADISDAQLERWAQWDGEPGAFASFIKEQHVTDGRINDWDEYQGKLDARKTAEANRQRRLRSEKKSEVRTQDVTRTYAPTVRYDNDTIELQEQKPRAREPEEISVEVLRTEPERQPLSTAVTALVAHASVGSLGRPDDRRQQLRREWDHLKIVGAGLVIAYWHRETGQPGICVADAPRQMVITEALELFPAGTHVRDRLSMLFHVVDGARRDAWTMGKDPKSPGAKNHVRALFKDRETMERHASRSPPYMRGELHSVALEHFPYTEDEPDGHLARDDGPKRRTISAVGARASG